MGEEYKNEEVYVTDYALRITHYVVTDHPLPIADRDTRESSVREMVKEALDFCFSTNRFLGRKALPTTFLQAKTLTKKCYFYFFFLAQVLSFKL
ncbi:hypothetical protein C5S32_06805 [ANME-1 cluster archaeon GoMg1]|nr:hypothetical protein [ANME-1 cluster archaeon GoMg1]